ncbi:MAG: type II toxin-antitoxin system HicB family antitoxin [Solirubrobacteraceae bacterium MAG38_C4-C5]|nr:type II toxin-antitoxin system HicB family antitoxin [Candidatus Siliceabacter maunaloa]
MTDPERYTTLLERASDGGWGAWSPDLPGCVALGDSFNDGVAEMRQAISFHLEGLAEDGEAIPEPSRPGIYISAEAVEPAAA